MERAHRALLRALQLALASSQPYTLGPLSRSSKVLRSLDGLAVQLGPAAGSRAAAPWASSHHSASLGSWRAFTQQQRAGVFRRRYSSVSGEPAPEEDVIKAKFVRFFALFMMVAAGVRVAPYAAAASVGHTLGLLDAQEPFFLKSGISRLLIVVRMSERGRERALEGGAVPKLLRLVAHEDEGVVDGALMALEELAQSEVGLEAVREAGGEAVLQAYLARTLREPQNEDAVYRAGQLLGDLRRAQVGDFSKRPS